MAYLKPCGVLSCLGYASTPRRRLKNHAPHCRPCSPLMETHLHRSASSMIPLASTSQSHVHRWSYCASCAPLVCTRSLSSCLSLISSTNPIPCVWNACLQASLDWSPSGRSIHSCTASSSSKTSWLASSSLPHLLRPFQQQWATSTPSTLLFYTPQHRGLLY
jgi:hypothetical protein